MGTGGGVGQLVATGYDCAHSSEVKHRKCTIMDRVGDTFSIPHSMLATTILASSKEDEGIRGHLEWVHISFPGDYNLRDESTWTVCIPINNKEQRTTNETNNVVGKARFSSTTDMH